MPGHPLRIHSDLLLLGVRELLHARHLHAVVLHYVLVRNLLAHALVLWTALERNLAADWLCYNSWLDNRPDLAHISVLLAHIRQAHALHLNQSLHVVARLASSEAIPLHATERPLLIELNSRGVVTLKLLVIENAIKIY